MFCWYECMCNNASMLGALGSEKRALDPMELKLLMVVSLCVGSGSWTWVLWKQVALTTEPSIPSLVK